MSSDLLERVQLLDPAVGVDPAAVGLWDAEDVLREVERRVDSPPLRSPRLRPALVAAASFVVVILVVGALAWLSRVDSRVDPADQPTVPTTVAPSTSAPPTSLGAAPEVVTDVRNFTWTQVALDDAVFGPSSRLMAVAASDSLVAVGGSESGSAAIWTSTDRINWTRVPHDEDLFGGPGDQEIKAIVPWRSGFVAAGEVGGIDDFDPLRVAVVWYSEDGFDWNRVPHDEAVFGGQGRQEVFSMAAGDDGLMMVGFDEAGPSIGSGEGMVAWTSTDGITWTKRLDPVPAVVMAVAPFPDGFLAAGVVTVSPPGSSIWSVSADGSTWDTLADASDLGDAFPNDAIATESTLVIIGSREDIPAVWTSPDGSSWTRTDLNALPNDVPVLGSVAAAESGLIVVGRGGDTGGNSAIVVSHDGLDWQVVDTPDALSMSRLESAAGFGGHFVVVGNGFDGAPQLWTTEN